MKTKIGETIVWDEKDRGFNRDIVCSTCLSKSRKQKCMCSEIEEYKAALEVLARRYSIMFPWKSQRARRVFEKVTIKFVKEKARKNIKRGKK